MYADSPVWIFLLKRDLLEVSLKIEKTKLNKNIERRSEKNRSAKRIRNTQVLFFVFE